MCLSLASIDVRRRSACFAKMKEEEEEEEAC
jgi:hypothetical protein